MRYEIHTGKFGQYFYDSRDDRDLPLADVLAILNRPAPQPGDPAFEMPCFLVPRVDGKPWCACQGAGKCVVDGKPGPGWAKCKYGNLYRGKHPAPCAEPQGRQSQPQPGERAKDLARYAKRVERWLTSPGMGMPLDVTIAAWALVASVADPAPLSPAQVEEVVRDVFAWLDEHLANFECEDKGKLEARYLAARARRKKEDGDE